MEAIIIIGILAGIVIAFFIGKEFQSIAEMKGYHESKYFWWCFLLAAVGMFMVVALPNRNDIAEKTHGPNDELPDL